MKVTIKNTNFDFSFNYSYLKRLGEKWNCKGIGDLFHKIVVMDFNEELEFNAIETLTDVLQTAVEMQTEDIVISEDDVLSLMFENPQVIADVITEIAKSMPVQKNQPKKKAVKK